jgi:hypothetical protein
MPLSTLVVLVLAAVAVSAEFPADLSGQEILDQRRRWDSGCPGETRAAVQKLADALLTLSEPQKNGDVSINVHLWLSAENAVRFANLAKSPLLSDAEGASLATLTKDAAKPPPMSACEVSEHIINIASIAVPVIVFVVRIRIGAGWKKSMLFVVASLFTRSVFERHEFNLKATSGMSALAQMEVQPECTWDPTTRGLVGWVYSALFGGEIDCRKWAENAFRAPPTIWTAAWQVASEGITHVASNAFDGIVDRGVPAMVFAAVLVWIVITFTPWGKLCKTKVLKGTVVFCQRRLDGTLDCTPGDAEPSGEEGYSDDDEGA